jgi:hypothetical protein
MRLGRVVREGLDGVEARLVAVEPERGLAIDLRVAERLRRERRGATPAAAARLAATLFPGSTTGAISAGEALLAGAAEAIHAAGDDASLPLDGLSWLPAVDPAVMRDCLAFKEHLPRALKSSKIVTPKTWDGASSGVRLRPGRPTTKPSSSS